MQLTPNCVCFTDPCINLLVRYSFTCEYHPALGQLLYLLQCIAARLQRTLTWVYEET